MIRHRPEESVRKKWYGRCRLCLKTGRLTKEHVPPESAFNKGSYRRFYVDQMAKADLLQWETKDVNANGIFVFSLCERCNQKTGRAYASAYAVFVQSLTDVATFENVDKDVEVELKNFSPVRVVKQAVSMVLSTSTPDSFSRYEFIWNPFLRADQSLPSTNLFANRPDQQRLREIYEKLRAFVNNRTTKGLPPGVRLYAYATANSGSGVMTGIMGSASLSTQKAFWGAVVGLWPVHWLLTFEDEPDVQLLDVTDWANDDYKTKRKVKVKIPCRWTYAKYPLDFRTPEQFLKDGFVARMRYEGYIPEAGADKEKMLAGALEFARRRGTKTTDGIFIKRFESCTYAEYKDRWWWFEQGSRKEVHEFLQARLAWEREQAKKASNLGS
jgi:hypothetical protein